MKKIIVLFAICIGMMPIIAQAQDQPDPETLLGGIQHVSLFVSPALKGVLLYDRTQSGLMAGGSGGVVLGRSLYLGAAGYRLVTDIKTVAAGSDSTSIGLQYGGGVVGYRLAPDDLIHLGVQVMAGYGEVEYGYGGRGHHHDDNFDDDDGGVHGSSGFYIAEPAVTAELNLISHVQLGVEAGYRFCTGVDSTMTGVTNKDLGGPSAAATLRVVLF